MKKLIISVAVLFLAAIPAKAQDDYPSAEIFGGYSYLNQDFIRGVGNDQQGFGFSIAGNLSSRYGFVSDFSYNRKSVDTMGFDFTASSFIFLFGPRFSARSSAATGFGHVLVGGTRVKVEDIFSETGFTLGIGGGVDINAGESFAIRLAQVDYLPTRLSGDWFHNFRFQIGVVFKAH